MRIPNPPMRAKRPDAKDVFPPSSTLAARRYGYEKNLAARKRWNGAPNQYRSPIFFPRRTATNPRRSGFGADSRIEYAPLKRIPRAIEYADSELPPRSSVAYGEKVSSSLHFQTALPVRHADPHPLGLEPSRPEQRYPGDRDRNWGGCVYVCQ